MLLNYGIMLVCLQKKKQTLHRRTSNSYKADYRRPTAESSHFVFESNSSEDSDLDASDAMASYYLWTQEKMIFC